MSIFLKELQFKLPWGHLAAKAWGSHDGCPILCLHGWLDNANTFDRLIPLLPKEYHYVALDFSGHGRSSHLPQGMRYQHLDYVTDIHRVVTALGWRKFSILGHSMGGVVGGLDLLMSHLKRSIVHYSRLNDANTAKVYTPEGALQRLLDGNPSLNTDTAKVLLQRGTKPVPDGVLFSRDIRVTLNSSAPLSIEQCLQVLKSIQSNVHIILANEGLSADQMRGVYTEMGQALLNGFKESLKDRFKATVVDGNHFVHLNEPKKVAKIITEQFYQQPAIHSQL